MRIIQYPHPTLRRTSKPLRKVDAELRKIVAQMLELMYEHQGVGLAANQVDLPYRLFVMNLASDPAVSDEERVFINPVLSQPKGSAEAEEGCLCLPGVYAQVKRPEKVVVNAYNLAGEEVTYAANDLMAQVVQHEVDHLDGVLFIDRLSPTALMAIKESLEELRQEFDNLRGRGKIPGDEEISARLAELEELRT